MSKKVPLPAKTYEKLEEKAAAVGLTPDELGAEIIIKKSSQASSTTEKPKRGKKIKAKELESNNKKPFINAYGFVRLPKNVQEKLGVTAGRKTPITIEVQGDALIIRKT